MGTFQYGGGAGATGATGPAGSSLIQTLSPAAAANVQFTAIPQTFRHLRIIGVLKLSLNDILTMIFNGDAAVHYSSNMASNPSVSQLGSRANFQLTDNEGNGLASYMLDISIPLYTDVTNGGTMNCRFAGTDVIANATHVGLSGGRWFGAAAINAIQITPNTGTVTGVLDLRGE